MSEYSLTIFNQKKAIAEKIITMDTWNDLKYWLKQQKSIQVENKADNRHILSGITKDNYKRKGSIEQTSKVYFTDIDDINGMTLNEFVKKHKHLNHNCIIYNSASCRKGDIRFRLVFHLNRKVKNYEYHHFWTNLNKLYGSVFDPQTNYIEKTNACPRTFKNALNFIYELKGNPLDVDEVKNMYIYRPPQSLSEKLTGLTDFKRKKRMLCSSSLKWSGINDCPFVPKNLVSEYNSIMDMDNSGRYHKFYKIMISIACKAAEKNYDLTENELLELMLEIDINKHQFNKQKNSLQKSARNAILYAHKAI